MRGLKSVVVISLLTIASSALAQEQPKLDRNDPNAVRCKRLDVIGSLARKERVCKTNAQWRASAEQQNRDADDLISRNRVGMNPSG
ncbi:hypothetical protein [Sphingobium sp. MK2]|uniref:hypothetical protein n=1 Tax=Sphingobium sp. MK2 TaxID=3116540 RepID=UPI0032E35FE9